MEWKARRNLKLALREFILHLDTKNSERTHAWQKAACLLPDLKLGWFQTTDNDGSWPLMARRYMPKG